MASKAIHFAVALYLVLMLVAVVVAMGIDRVTVGTGGATVATPQIRTVAERCAAVVTQRLGVGAMAFRRLPTVRVRVEWMAVAASLGQRAPFPCGSVATTADLEPVCQDRGAVDRRLLPGDPVRIVVVTVAAGALLDIRWPFLARAVAGEAGLPTVDARGSVGRRVSMVLRMGVPGMTVEARALLPARRPHVAVAVAWSAIVPAVGAHGPVGLPVHVSGRMREQSMAFGATLDHTVVGLLDMAQRAGVLILEPQGRVDLHSREVIRRGKV
jgi:hypothetical protein